MEYIAYFSGAKLITKSRPQQQQRNARTGNNTVPISTVQQVPTTDAVGSTGAVVTNGATVQTTGGITTTNAAAAAAAEWMAPTLSGGVPAITSVVPAIAGMRMSAAAVPPSPVTRHGQKSDKYEFPKNFRNITASPRFKNISGT